MIDGVWTPGRGMWPVRSPFTVAIQRTAAHCRQPIKDFATLRYQCSGCLDRVLTEDY